MNNNYVLYSVSLRNKNNIRRQPAQPASPAQPNPKGCLPNIDRARPAELFLRHDHPVPRVCRQNFGPVPRLLLSAEISNFGLGAESCPRGQAPDHLPDRVRGFMVQIFDFSGKIFVCFFSKIFWLFFSSICFLQNFRFFWPHFSD